MITFVFKGIKLITFSRMVENSPEAFIKRMVHKISAKFVMTSIHKQIVLKTRGKSSKIMKSFARISH